MYVRFCSVSFKTYLKPGSESTFNFYGPVTYHHQHFALYSVPWICAAFVSWRWQCFMSCYRLTTETVVTLKFLQLCLQRC